MSPAPAPSRETSAPLAVVSHRANAGYYPENTLLGIEASIREGAHAIEVDVRATSDGALVLMHDETLERVTGDPRPIAAVALADLEGLRVHGGAANHPPEPIPTLEDALHVIDGRAAIVIDFVIEEVAQDCVDLVNGAGAGEWTWWTAHPPRLASMLAESCPGSPSYLGWTPRAGIPHPPAEAVDLAERHGLAGLMANHRY
ncbi:MAG: glycerophosphodiester phosphodiesterase family protein, partial [Dehalococcoidia bacterium]